MSLGLSVLAQVKLIPEVLSCLQKVQSLIGSGPHHLVGAVILYVVPSPDSVCKKCKIFFIFRKTINFGRSFKLAASSCDRYYKRFFAVPDCSVFYQIFEGGISGCVWIWLICTF